MTKLRREQLWILIQGLRDGNEAAVFSAPDVAKDAADLLEDALDMAEVCRNCGCQEIR